MELHSHNIKLTLFLFVHFQIRKKALYGEIPIQKKERKEPMAARFKNHSFENLKCQSLSHQTIVRQLTTNSIRYAERNHNNGHFLIKLCY